MAELPSIVHLTSHPTCLSILGPSVYEDENQRTWLQLVRETGGALQLQLYQVTIPIEYLPPTTSPPTSSTTTSMLKLHLGIQYLDSMGRFWRIVQHVKENGREEMILERMEDS